MKTRICLIVFASLFLPLLLSDAVRGDDEKEDRGFYLRLADSFLDSGNYDRALSMFEKVRSLDPDLDLGKKMAAARAGLAREMLGKGEYRKAVENFEEARRLDKEIGLVSPLEEAYRKLASRCLEDGDIDGALWSAEKALALSPTQTEAMRIRGEALVKQGEHEKALALFQDLSKLLQQDPELLMKIGMLNEKLGRGKQAEETYRAIISRNEQFIPAYVALGEYHERRGNLTKAVEIYRKGIEKAPSDAGLRTNLAWAYIEDGDYLDAYKECTTAIELDADNTYAWNYLGLIFMKINRFNQAREAFTRSLAAKPDYLGARLNLAFLYGLIGRSEDAIREYKEILERNPDSAEAHYNLGINYKKENRFVLAQYHLERAAALYGHDSALGRKALERLKSLK